MLARLRHRAVRGGYHQNGTIHLGGTGDHVLDVVAVAGHIHMGIVTLVGLIFHVGNVDGNTALFLFRCVVDRVERTELCFTL